MAGHAFMASGSDEDLPPHLRLREEPSPVETVHGTALNALTYKHDEWILDGGASHHMTPNREVLFDYVPDTLHP